MNKFSERRLKENEVIFREANQGVAEFVEEQTSSRRQMVGFYCECSNLDCRRRIRITTAHFHKFHPNERQFIIVPGHEQSNIEKVIKHEIGFDIVEKFGPMPSAESIDRALSNVAG